MEMSNGSNGAEGRHGAVQDELEALRAELDGVDNRILDDVRERIQVCVRIAEVKRRNAIPMLQPHRMGFVHERARSYALGHELSPDFFRALYELLISETCRVEDLIIDSSDTSDATSPSRFHQRKR